MTTPQPAALPELPEPGYVHEDGHDEYGYATYGRAYTADQMRARDAMWAERLSALQPQPAAAVSHDALWASDEVMALNAELGLTLDQLSKLARLILALRPQAVPMTPAVDAERESCAATAQRYVCQVGDVAWEIAAAIRARGITAQGGEGEQR